MLLEEYSGLGPSREGCNQRPGAKVGVDVLVRAKPRIYLPGNVWALRDARPFCFGLVSDIVILGINLYPAGHNKRLLLGAGASETCFDEVSKLNEWARCNAALILFYEKAAYSARLFTADPLKVPFCPSVCTFLSLRALP